MNLYLPNELIYFPDAFDKICDRIISSAQDQIFYVLCVELIDVLRKHPLISSYLGELESKIERLDQEFSLAALQAFEEEWLFLWRMHAKYGAVRRALIRIRHLIIKLSSTSFMPLFHQINFDLLHVRSLPTFCRWIKKTNSFFQNFRQKNAFILRNLHITRHLKNKTRKFSIREFGSDKLYQGLSAEIAASSQTSSRVLLEKKYRHINEELVTYMRSLLILQSTIPGNDLAKKRKNMCAASELDPIFCWGRFVFLQRCWNFNNTVSLAKPIKGKWDTIKGAAWKLAWDTADKMVFLGAKMDLNNSLNAQSSIFQPSPFLNVESQINRKDYEKFLQALKNHVHTQLLRIQNMPASEHSERLTEADSFRIEREDHVVKHAKKYRARFPLASHTEMYSDYKKSCPRGHSYGETKWKAIIKEHRLDPRTSKEKRKKSGRPPVHYS